MDKVEFYKDFLKYIEANYQGADKEKVVERTKELIKEEFIKAMQKG